MGENSEVSIAVRAVLELLFLTLMWKKEIIFRLNSMAMYRRLPSTFASCFVLFIALHSKCSGNVMHSYGIGAMVSLPEYEKIFQDAVDEINANSSSLLRTARLNASSYVLSPNPIRSALDVCEKLVAKGVTAVIVSHPKDELSPPISVSYACSFYHIPVIGISARETIFSDKVMCFILIM